MYNYRIIFTELSLRPRTCFGPSSLPSLVPCPTESPLVAHHDQMHRPSVRPCWALAVAEELLRSGEVEDRAVAEVQSLMA
jgi:hypothetical protein